jgi:cysteine-rich repeat protein
MGTGGAATGGMGGMGTGGMGGAPPCGNGTLDPGEGCDDGNVAATDGCSNTCMLEGDADMCPTGATLPLNATGLWISDTTAGKNTNNDASCGGNSAGEMIFAITPAQNGVVTVTLTGDYAQMVLEVRDQCDDNGANEDFCIFGNVQVQDTFTAVMDQTVWVFVGGRQGNEGNFTLHLAYN